MRLLDMIKCVKNQGLRPMGGDAHLNGCEDDFFKAADATEHFLFESTNFRPISVGHGNIDIDAPFPIFSIELADMNRALAGSAAGDKEFYETYSVLIEERPNDVTRYYTYVWSKTRDEYQVAVTENTSWFSPLVKTFLDQLNNLEVGIEKIKKGVCYRKGKKKKDYITKERTFIVCSKAQKATYEATGRKLEWDNSHSYRGHWRRQFHKDCEGKGCTKCNNIGLRPGFLGVNRKGERNVPGKTWIPHGIRGKGLIPTKKVRQVPTKKKVVNNVHN